MSVSTTIAQTSTSSVTAAAAAAARPCTVRTLYNRSFFFFFLKKTKTEIRRSRLKNDAGIIIIVSVITRVTSATSPTRIFTFPTVRNILQAKIPRKSTCELLCSNFKCAYTIPSDQCVQSGVTFCLLNYFRSTRGQIHIYTFPLPKCECGPQQAAVVRSFGRRLHVLRACRRLSWRQKASRRSRRTPSDSVAYLTIILTTVTLITLIHVNELLQNAEKCDATNNFKTKTI
ncbi:hypothetical protein AGLY_013106 [Aphis glycines]|uniref:Uncharacterized protein n=1 Tax=Aphis glycines TaxID=307491 RepID=A0A6G0T9X9_APHGL|nr:hypothetical protein AGLY_013106 [Aphis glycines]